MKTKLTTADIVAHLAYLPTDVYSQALGQVLYRLYLEQSGTTRRSGYLTGLKKYQTDAVAAVRHDGSWRILNRDWQRGELPKQIVDATLNIVRNLGEETPCQKKLNWVISQSVLSVKKHDRTTHKGKPKAKAKKQDGLSRRERRTATMTRRE